ncbi:MAG: hypothetical protein IT162_15335 [Bryobacterales bacterium]|nr:hypothetical protein [Bryobacterales bacterium]
MSVVWRPTYLLLVLVLAGCAQTDEVLAPGEPPLTAALADEYAATLGAVLDVPMTAADLDFFRTTLRADWAAKQKRRMALIEARRAVDRQPAAERAAGLQAIRPRVLALLETSAAAGDREAQFLLAKTRRRPGGLTDAQLDALLAPRRDDDERLESEGIPAQQVQSTYPPRAPRGNDAVANLFDELGTERSYLQEGDLRKMVRYFEWSLEAPLVNSERNQLRRQLLELHRKNGGQDPAFQFLQNGVGYKLGGVDLSFLDDPFADHKRRVIQRECVPQLARDAPASGLSRWLHARYQAAHPALTPAPHVLTPLVARVYAEHVVFAVNEVVGQAAFTVTPALTKALLRRLLNEWPALPAARRQEICDLPFDWAHAKQDWPRRPEHQKTEMRLAWGREFSAAFPEIRPFHETRASEVAKAKAKVEAEQQQRQRQQAAASPAQQAQQALHNQTLANQIALAGFQSQMQIQQIGIRALQLGQLQMHVANLNIASNAGNSGTTWQIVYR